jgi:hypothetical protein
MMTDTALEIYPVPKTSKDMRGKILIFLPHPLTTAVKQSVSTRYMHTLTKERRSESVPHQFRDHAMNPTPMPPNLVFLHQTILSDGHSHQPSQPPSTT